MCSALPVVLSANVNEPHGSTCERICPTQAREPREVAVGGAQGQSVLEGECGQVGVGDEIAVHARRAQELS